MLESLSAGRLFLFMRRLLLDRDRKRPTIVGNMFTKWSTSVWVLPIPRLNLIELCTRFEESPIARSTCDGSSVPEEQAEPVDTATPSRSSAMRRDSASTPAKLIFEVLGTR